MRLSHQDVTSITLKVLFIVGLISASFWILQPFLLAIVWATTLVVATWPIMSSLQRHLGNRRGFAVLVMTLALLLILLVPFWLAVSTVLTHLDRLGELAQTFLSLRVPPPPDWLKSLPLIGPPATQAWQKLAYAGVQELAPRLTPYAGALTQWFASAAGSLGGMFVQFLLTTLIAAIMYMSGERAVATVRLFGYRLGGERGAMAVTLAGSAIRSVALGIVVTAVAQTAVSGIGLALVGMPYAALLTALILVMCLIQIGPGLVMIPAVIWLYYSGDVILGTVLLVFTIIATTIDQFIRPFLIRRGADLPLLLIIAGVIGGLIAFGLLGMFIGPVVLAVAYTLLDAWMTEGDAEAAAVDAGRV